VATALHVRDVQTSDFQESVIDESFKRPVAVDFWAPWCGPCRQLTPILEKAVRAAKGAVKLVKLNIDDHPQIPGQMGVQSIPVTTVDSTVQISGTTRTVRIPAGTPVDYVARVDPTRLPDIIRNSSLLNLFSDESIYRRMLRNNAGAHCGARRSRPRPRTSTGSDRPSPNPPRRTRTDGDCCLTWKFRK